MPTKPTKRKPLGTPLPEYVGDIPAPTADQIAEYDALWDANAPAKYRGILRARPKSMLADGEVPASGWTWDEVESVYIHVSGRRVTRKEAHFAMTKFAERYGNQ